MIEWRDNLGPTAAPDDHAEWRDAIRGVSRTVQVVLSRRGAGAWFLMLAQERTVVSSGGPLDRRRELLAALRAAGKCLTND